MGELAEEGEAGEGGNRERKWNSGEEPGEEREPDNEGDPGEGGSRQRWRTKGGQGTGKGRNRARREKLIPDWKGLEMKENLIVNL